jgi:large subunit ribosomal protein L30
MSETKATMRIQYYRSKIQAPMKHKNVVKGLGKILRRSAAW